MIFLNFFGRIPVHIINMSTASRERIILEQKNDAPPGFRDFSRIQVIVDGDGNETRIPAGELRSLFSNDKGVPRLWLGGEDDETKESLRRIRAGWGKPGGWGVVNIHEEAKIEE